MRPLSLLTLIGGAILSLPTIFWAMGIDPSLIAVLHAAAAVLCARLLYVVARHPGSSWGDAAWVGGYAGIIGATMTQLLLHMGWSAPLNVAFGNYGALGAAMFRLDMLSAWWPYVMILWGGAVYGLLGVGLAAWARSRRGALAA